MRRHALFIRSNRGSAYSGLVMCVFELSWRDGVSFGVFCLFVVFFSLFFSFFLYVLYYCLSITCA